MDSALVVAIVALVVSIASAIAAFRTDTRSIEVETYHRATELFLRLNDVFLAYPLLRPYFYDGEAIADDLPDEDRQRVLMAAELILDVFDWIGHDCEGASDTDRASWLEFIRSIFEASPATWEYHQDHPEWHPVLDAWIFHNANQPPPDQPAKARPLVAPT